ncbi:MAG: GNAT family N-acetyltransferase [Stappiaceae bacterium]
MTETVILRAQREDGPRIGEVFTASRRLMTYLPPLHTPQEESDFICRSVVIEKTVYVAVIDRRIVGLIAGEGAWIDYLYVHPDHIHCGVGTRLLSKVKSNTDELTLWTFQQNIIACAFYEKQGFRAVEWTDGASNMERLPDVRYFWSKLNSPKTNSQT